MERRLELRHLIGKPVTATILNQIGGALFPAVLVDLSLSGVCLECEKKLLPGSEIVLFWRTVAVFAVVRHVRDGAFNRLVAGARILEVLPLAGESPEPSAEPVARPYWVEVPAEYHYSV